MPGALVDAQVQHVLSDGLVLSFLTFFTGTVDQFHLAQVTPSHILNQSMNGSVRQSSRQRQVQPIHRAKG